MPFFVVLFLALPGRAAPYAELVMDARTGEVLKSSNADTRLHPASLTKMMTLYIAFEAVRKGEITLDTEVRISRNAANEPPSKLGLRAGQTIALRYLIRAAAVKSANDAATAIGEAIAGSEDAFAERMNRTAEALGMTASTFRNAHGLTRSGHLSTARDMSVMGRRMFYDYPQYYNLFSRRSTDASITQVRNTNRRFLNAYRGADGIKTGFTNAAGFNLVSSAERGGVRIIATVFGGRSTATRNARIMELLDYGFAHAPARVTERKPELPTYNSATRPGVTAPARSMRPVMRSYLLALQVSAVRGETRVVTNASTAGRDYGIQLDPQGTRSAADKLLLRTALQELDTLDDALRRIERVQGGFKPSFVGLSEREAQRACTRLRANSVACSVTFGS
ncbi:D-alanyl-D-alanine carboxypeptidase family protein [uncultured Jannaschia sp.]|uniref:D-alanyl-D-alanine carboxypeptidase family protein n=1 Tax=uncultured Jannaschia sp. TaxID=293347 RepID=UPI0026167841|nr:D-alanyl-D-alanine carboxypeptidase family protein [uncultured Jannaschia sp.]